jgi:hypothetical protein
MQRRISSTALRTLCFRPCACEPSDAALFGIRFAQKMRKHFSGSALKSRWRCFPNTQARRN